MFKTYAAIVAVIAGWITVLIGAAMLGDYLWNEQRALFWPVAMMFSGKWVIDIAVEFGKGK